MTIKILIAAHKQCWVPEDDMYLPVHVGSALSDERTGWQRDDDGDNISGKNKNYCELTGIYWAWKNLDADYIGLVHYRRYFTNRFPLIRPGGDRRKYILSRRSAERILAKTDVVVPRKRRYYIETLFSHYQHTHEEEHLKKTERLLREMAPEYLPAFLRIYRRRSAHMFNMFIMKAGVFREYCEWLFPILERLETEIDIRGMTPYEARYMGRISELLLDVWLETRGISCRELPYVHLGKIHWGKKIRSFLGAKFGNEKYRDSF